MSLLFESVCLEGNQGCGHEALSITSLDVLLNEWKSSCTKLHCAAQWSTAEGTPTGANVFNEAAVRVCHHSDLLSAGRTVRAA